MLSLVLSRRTNILALFSGDSCILQAGSAFAVEITPLFPSLLLFTHLGVSPFRAGPGDPTFLPLGVWGGQLTSGRQVRPAAAAAVGPCLCQGLSDSR